MDDDQVGYKKPPKHTQIKPGERRNPNGRRGKHLKPVLDNSEAAILQRLDSELIKLGGKMVTRLEAELQLLQRKALSGDTRASQLLDKKRAAAGLNKPAQRGGVLVVPAPLDFDEWGSRAAKQQAKFRVRDPDQVAEMHRQLEYGINIE